MFRSARASLALVALALVTAPACAPESPSESDMDGEEQTGEAEQAWTPYIPGPTCHTIDSAYATFGGATAFGSPLGPAHAGYGGTGQVRDYQKGSIYRLNSGCATVLFNPLRSHYQALGAEGGFLGYPSSNDATRGDGTRYAAFKGGGTMLYNPAVTSDAREIHGDIRTAWQGLGAFTALIGLPTTDETPTPDGVGRYNHFQSGSIYWKSTTGAHDVRGSIRSKWANLGWEKSFLGYPITGETITPDGIGRYNHFEGGSIYSTSTTGAHEVHGDIRNKWASLGWENSFLGYPTSDEISSSDGGGRLSRFQGGTICARSSGVTVTTSLTESCNCAPITTCGGATCGTIPNGCGGVLNCGPACGGCSTMTAVFACGGPAYATTSLHVSGTGCGVAGARQDAASKAPSGCTINPGTVPSACADPCGPGSCGTAYSSCVGSVYCGACGGGCTGTIELCCETPGLQGTGVTVTNACSADDAIDYAEANILRCGTYDAQNNWIAGSWSEGLCQL